MKQYTLREIYESSGITRRAVQGYEKAGLVKSVGKNNQGHLLYDEKGKDRILRIHLFQQFGFSIKEICDVIDADKSILKNALIEKVEQMEKDRQRKEQYIQLAKEMIDLL